MFYKVVYLCYMMFKNMFYKCLIVLLQFVLKYVCMVWYTLYVFSYLFTRCCFQTCSDKTISNAGKSGEVTSPWKSGDLLNRIFFNCLKLFIPNWIVSLFDYCFCFLLMCFRISTPSFWEQRTCVWLRVSSLCFVRIFSNSAVRILELSSCVRRNHN